MARGAVLITFAEVFGKQPQAVDQQAILSKYRRIEVVALLAKINCLMGTWKNQPDFQLDALLCRNILQRYDSQIEAIRVKSPEQRMVFSRLPLIYTIKQAFLFANPEGVMPNSPRALEDIGLAILMSNDLVLPNRAAGSASTLETLTKLFPFTDYMPQDEYVSDIGRTLLMFEETAALPAIVQAPDYIDLSGMFQKIIGVNLREFCELVFACATRFFNPKIEELFVNPRALVVDHNFFQKTKITPDRLRSFFSKVSLPEGKYCNEIRSREERPGDDLTLIQQFPLFEILNDVFLSIDPGFLLEKAGRGLYWTLFSELPDGNDRSRLAAFWGRLFEHYVNGILESNYSEGGRLITEPQFLNGDQAFDACVLEDRDLVVFEHKSSVLRADSKYSGDMEKLGEELRSKFIEGSAEGRKGLSQLKHNLGRFFDGQTVAGIRPESVDRIYPALVCLDRSMAVPYMGRYLDEEFRRDFPRKKIRQVITPLLTLSINDVENLSPYFHKFELSEIFESYHAMNKSQLWSISRSDVPILKHAEKGRDVVKEKFAEFTRKMETDLFGTNYQNKENAPK
jgi:hypothetical protein